MEKQYCIEQLQKLRREAVDLQRELTNNKHRETLGFFIASLEGDVLEVRVLEEKSNLIYGSFHKDYEGRVNDRKETWEQYKRAFRPKGETMNQQDYVNQMIQKYEILEDAMKKDMVIVARPDHMGELTEQLDVVQADIRLLRGYQEREVDEFPSFKQTTDKWYELHKDKWIKLRDRL